MVIENDCYIYVRLTGNVLPMTYYDIIGTNMFCYPLIGINPISKVYKIHDPNDVY